MEAARRRQSEKARASAAGGHGLGRLLRQVVPGRQRVAAHVGRLLAPGREHVVGAPDQAALAPEREERRRDPAVGVGGVVLEVDRGRGAVVLAGGGDRRRVGEAAQVLVDGLRREEAVVALAPGRELACAGRTPGRRRSAARAAAPAGSGRTSGSSRWRTPCRSARTSSRSARCRAPPAARPPRGGRAPSGARPARRGRARRRRSGEAERAHHRHLVGRHRPLGVGRMVGRRGRLRASRRSRAGRRDHGEAGRDQPRRDAVPAGVGLRIAVQQQDRRPVAGRRGRGCATPSPTSIRSSEKPSNTGQPSGCSGRLARPGRGG